MQNNRLLQARHRYLQARRDLEYKKLKEEERLKELGFRVESEVPVVKPVEIVDLKCPVCSKEFKTNAGFSSHKRSKACEGL